MGLGFYDATAKVANKQLKAKVEKRLRAVKKVIQSVEQIVGKMGEITKQKVENSHTHTVQELKNFGNFSFEVSSGETMFGGNTIKAIYGGWLVFSAYYQAMGDIPIVNVFSEKIKWQSALARAINNQHKIAVRIAREKEKANRCVERRIADSLAAEKLRKDAKRLGLS